MKSIERQQIKQAVLENRYKKMNEMQRKAIFKTKGPVLILAGAGSGKTTVLVNRIAYLLDFGDAYYDETEISDDCLELLKRLSAGEKCSDDELSRALKVKTVNPWNVLAITFTNKAANELKERLFSLLGEKGAGVSAGTFHSICLKILRREIDRLDYAPSFSIYDTDDAVRLIKDCETELMLDDKMFPSKSMLFEISHAKDSLISPEEFLSQCGGDFRKEKIAKLYELYQKKLKEYNAVDFDDIICLTVKLFLTCPDVLEHYRNFYKYVLVDEYQDTNHAQYMLINLLSKQHNNICVVGDDDQSIYKFRGATIENILNFEHDYKDACVIRLEQNYRSTQTILDAANAVISHNKARKGKNLWSDCKTGDLITAYRAVDEGGEAQFIANRIQENTANGAKFSDNAVLYRMNSQSAGIERALVKAAIPYHIFGGTKFYERKEIKDVMSYFHLLINNHDLIRLKRVINEPKRGIGDATIKSVETIAQIENIPMFEVLRNALQYDVIAKKAGALSDFVAMLGELSELSLTLSLPELLDELMEKTGYHIFLKSQGREGEGRLENIEELKSNLIHYENENENATLAGFLEEVSLYTDLDNLNDSDDRVTLMTIHSAKGLEFRYVFIAGMEESVFPSYLSSNSDEEIEEERRLAYVALTRAKEHLCIINASQRMLFGRTSRNMPSRFLGEIPEELTTIIDDTTRAYGYQSTKPQKVKASYKPEIEGTVGISRQVEKALINFAVGDSVSHKVFGNGVVKSMTPMSNDVLVEIKFNDKVGIKKIMANFAKLQKV